MRRDMVGPEVQPLVQIRKFGRRTEVGKPGPVPPLPHPTRVENAVQRRTGYSIKKTPFVGSVGQLKPGDGAGAAGAAAVDEISGMLPPARIACLHAFGALLAKKLSDHGQ